MGDLTIELAVKILVALLLGGAIGWQRERAQKPAGLRTHILIVLGATVVTQASILMGRQLGGDPTRIASNIIVGIGFLGAGTIMKEGPTVYGLTTAATIWVAGALGLVIGTGFYAASMMLTLATLLVLVVLRRVETHLHGKIEVRRYQVVAESPDRVIERVKRALDRTTQPRGNLEFRREGSKIRLSFELADEPSAHAALFEDLRKYQEVLEVGSD